MSLNTWQKVLSSQISKSVALENITELQFTINPKKLGRVSVTLQMDAGNVNVSIFLRMDMLQTFCNIGGRLETLLSDHGMKLASYNASSEQNGRDKRDRAPTNGRQSGIVERDGSKTAGGLQSESKSRTSNTRRLRLSGVKEDTMAEDDSNQEDKKVAD